jgi:hypothetical protein
MAEAYAMDGFGMGRYMRFENPTGFEVLARYTNFMHQHRRLFDEARPFSDVALVLPRQSVWNRHPESLDAFREIGQALVERQVLLDVVSDEAITGRRLSNYPAIVLADAISLSDSQLSAIRNYAATGGKVFVRGRAATIDENGKARRNSSIDGAVSVDEETADSIVAALTKMGASTFKAPWTIRATAYSQTDRTVLHLVNYDRDETPDKTLKGPELERPKAAEDIQVSLRLPKGRAATGVVQYSPDSEPLKLSIQQRNGQVVFRVPRVLVYAVVSIETQAN